MAAHTADGIQAELIDVQGFRVDQFITDMGHQYFAKDDFPRLPDRQRHHPPAFQSHWRFADARAFDQGAGDSRKAGSGQFIEARGEGDGADVHGFHQGIADDIDGEFLIQLDVARGVLRALVAIIFHTQGKDRRVGGQCVEKAEGRGVDAALAIDRGDQGNRAGHHTADQYLVFVPRAHRAEVEAVHGQYSKVRGR